MAFITNKNMPKLNMVIGIVNKMNKGRIRIFNIAITNAAMIAVKKLSICIPGSKYDAIITPIALISIFNKKLILRLNEQE